MVAALPTTVMTGCALIAVLSWTFQGLTCREKRRQLVALAIAGWVALSWGTEALGAVHALAGGRRPPLVALEAGGTALLALATPLGLSVLLQRVRPAVRPGTHVCLIVESLEISCCSVAVLWASVGDLATLPLRDLVLLVPAGAEVAVAYALLRSSARGPGGKARGHRSSFPWGAAAFLSFAAAHECRLLVLAGTGPEGGAVPWVFSLGYLLLSLSALTEFRRQGLESYPCPAGAFFPVSTALGVGAVVVLCVAADRDGPAVVLLGAVAVLSIAGQRSSARENRALEAELRGTRQRLAAFLENTEETVLRVDADGRVSSVSSAARRLLLVDPGSLVGRRMTALLPPRVRHTVSELLSEVIAGDRDVCLLETELLPPAVGTVVLRLRHSGGGAVATFTDVTETAALRDRVDRLSRFDQLTALPNHAHLSSATDSWLGAGARVTVFHIDVLGFHGINDRFGRESGDRVLVEVADRLRGAVDDLDVAGSMIARVGGDEFVVSVTGLADPKEICRDPAAESAGGTVPTAEFRTAQSLLASVRPSFLVGDRTVRLDLSIGVARSADLLPGHDASVLLHRAGVALAAAKRADPGPVVCWDRRVEQAAVRRMDIAIGLRRALDTGRLRLAYQPLVRLSDGAVIGVEALVRVRERHMGSDALSWLPEVVSPEELVEVAEDSGAIQDLGEWVLVEATRQAARWRAQGHDLSVCVNVSVRQLAAGGLADLVRRVLRTSQLSPDRLVIEVTESRLLGEGDPAVGELKELADDGVVLAIDDFGTGYSSLSYLLRLPVRSVKMDREMLAGLGKDPRAMTLVRSVIGMLRALGMLVVAEGLEDSRTLHLVRDLGAYSGQGFVLCRALPPDELQHVLESSPLDLASDGARQSRPGRSCPQRGESAGRTALSELSPPEPGSVPAARNRVRYPDPASRTATVVVSDRETGRGGD